MVCKRTNTVLNTLPPFGGFMPSSPVIPFLYWEADTPEKQILRICCHLDKLTEYAEEIAEQVNTNANSINTFKGEVETLLNSFKKEIEEFKAEELETHSAMNEAIAKNAAEIQALKNSITEIQASAEVWDITKGIFDNSVNVMRRTAQVLATPASEFLNVQTVAKLKTSDLKKATCGEMLNSTFGRNKQIPYQEIII